MRKIIILALSLTLMTTSLFAQVSSQKSAENATRIAKLLVSKQTPAKVKKLLSAVVGGQSYENRVSILSVDSATLNGAHSTTIEIGVDDTSDDDNGWGTVYRIEVKESRTGISEVKLIMVAG